MRACVAVMLVSLILAIVGCATIDPLEDLRIEAEVKARLVAEKDANLSRLGVMSNNGTVYLSGTVESPDERAQAERLTRGVRGVKQVVNSLEVTCGSTVTNTICRR